MEECMIFPRDPDTVSVIRDIEEYLGLPYKDINEISYWELVGYINQLVLLLY